MRKRPTIYCIRRHGTD